MNGLWCPRKTSLSVGTVAGEGGTNGTLDDCLGKCCLSQALGSTHSTTKKMDGLNRFPAPRNIAKRGFLGYRKKEKMTTP